MEPELKRKNLKFILNIDERVPAQFNTDEKRLSRILYHLLENAIKFTEKGQISVTLEFIRKRKNYVRI